MHDRACRTNFDDSTKNDPPIRVDDTDHLSGIVSGADK